MLGAVMVWPSAADAAELFMFRRDGCSWCAKWDREIGPIYPKTEFNSRAPLRHVNLDRDPDPPIVHAPIRYTPTFVLVEDGKEVGPDRRLSGRRFFLGAAGKSAGAIAAAPRPGRRHKTFRRLPAPAPCLRSAPDEGPRRAVIPRTLPRRRSSFRPASTST